MVCALLLIAVTFSGCSADRLKSIFGLDTDGYDPAMEMAADVLNKTVEREGVVSGAFTYLIFTDKTAAITQYNGAGVLEIPEELDGYPVVALENKALYRSEITELILPDSLLVVGNFAAMYCEKLEKVSFGSHIQSIGVSAFESQGNDANGTGGGSLTTLEFRGKGPEMIRENAFYFADKLTEISLPQGVKTIENWAFAKCYAAERIDLGEGLEVLGDHAFLKCKKVKEAVIPGSCKTIETSTFYQCTALESLTIGEGVQILKKGAFEECAALTSVTLPESITTMEAYVFYNCKALQSCTMGTVSELDKDIFEGDTQVTISAPAGSAAEQYAQTNGIPFQAI